MILYLFEWEVGEQYADDVNLIGDDIRTIERNADVTWK